MKVKLIGALFAMLLPLAIAGCGSSGGTTSATSSSSSSASTAASSSASSGGSSSNPTLTVWVDSPRVPDVKAFEKAYPNIPVKMNILNDNIGNDKLRGKFELFNKAGSGWPDVIFFPTNSDISWAASKQIHYTANMKNVIPKSVQNGFASAAMYMCNVNGKLICLRNDDAADVLWYNAKLFKKWGYTPPKTWPQYESLALKIAKQHPGYISGFVGTSYTFDRYFWGSGCPANEPVGGGKYKINLNSPKCTRVVTMLDKLIKAKAVSTAGLFSSQAAKLGKKVVMTPGATWYGVFEFKDAFKVPSGEITATDPLTWPGFNYTGDEGGGLWGMSSHIHGKLQQEAAKFLEFAVTNKFRLNNTTFPAYGPLETPWIKKNLVQSGYFADPNQMIPAFKKAVKMVWSGHPYTEFDPDGIWDTTVVPALQQGKTLKQIWPTYQKQLVNYAKLYGYQVAQ